MAATVRVARIQASSLSITPAFTGGGTLAVALSPSVPLTAAFTGSGTVGVTAAPTVPLAAAYTAAGQLAVTLTPTVAVHADFTAGGGLTVTVAPTVPVAAAFAGAGAFTVTLDPVPPTDLAADFTATGTLTVALFVARDVDLTFTPLPDRWRFTPTPSRWSFTEAPMDLINLAEGGVGYVGGTYTETAGKDITATTVVLAVGDYTASGGDWRAPDVTAQGATTADKVVKLLIGADYTPTKPDSGDTWLWGRLTDAPEVEASRLCPIPITYA